MIQMITWAEHVRGERAGTGLRQRDNAVCTWEGREFRVLAVSATTTLARQLLAAGCPDQPWEARTPDGTRSVHGPSLHAWAKVTVQENDQGFRIRPFTEHPRAGDAVDATRRPAFGERPSSRPGMDGDLEAAATDLALKERQALVASEPGQPQSAQEEAPFYWTVDAGGALRRVRFRRGV